PVEHDLGALRRDGRRHFEQSEVRGSGAEASNDPEDADVCLEAAHAPRREAQRLVDGRAVARLPPPGPPKIRRTGGDERNALRNGSSVSNDSASATATASARARWCSAVVSSFVLRARSARVTWIRQAVAGMENSATMASALSRWRSALV